MIDIFGTLGPACDSEAVLSEMFSNGMTGIRVNLSHVMLSDCAASIDRVKRAAKENGVSPKILIDMQGPELRIGRFEGKMDFKAGETIELGGDGIPLDAALVKELTAGDEVLLDDGKIFGEISFAGEQSAKLRIIRGGELTQRKSILVKGKDLRLSAITSDDMENLKLARDLGIIGIMQPFVRSREDLMEVRDALDVCGCTGLRIYAKIENMEGVKNIGSFIDLCDEVIIARGDLGNSMDLWKLPRVQKEIAGICNEAKKPFMVVTQMLASMEKSEVPTRAEVSDIFNAVLDGASSVMVTGETAIGVNPAEVIKYLSNTAREAEKYIGEERK
nr:pyruvate kinase [Butyrivibrio sp.]